MADEQFVFGLEYTGRDQIANLDNDLTHLSTVLAEIRSGMSAGPIASEALLERLSATVQGQFSKLEEARLALAKANLAGQNVENRIAIPAAIGAAPYSSEAVKAGGFKSLNEQLAAEITAIRDVSIKQRGLAAETAKAQAALNQATSADKALASVGQILTKFQERRVKAEQDAARAAELSAEADRAKASRLASVDAEFAALQPQPYASPDLTSTRGRLEESVNAAQVGYEVATRKRTAAFTADNRTVESMLGAHRAYLASQASLNAATRQLAIAETRESGGFINQFQAGFKGVTDRPYAEQIGQAFKFSVLYGAAYRVLFGLTQTLQGALQEGIAFQQSMTELSIASGQSVDSLEDLRKQLGDAATQAGAAPSQGVLVGARSLGLFGAAAGSGATKAQQDRIATLSASVVSRAAFGSQIDPAELQRNLAAIAQAFQQGPEGQVRAFDLDAYLSRKFGIAPGSTYQSVAESATVGRAAGFSQEQITAIAADIQSRTGQSDSTVAGFMAQIFSRAGEGALLGVDQKYGVDATKDLATQISQLAEIYKKRPEARDDISAVFGRGKVQNAAIALLQDYGAVQSAANKAQTGALGAGDKAFNLRLANVGGQLARFGGDLKALESELGRSGLLNVIGGAILVLDKMVQGFTDFLQVFDKIPGLIRSIIPLLIAEEIVRRRLIATQAAEVATAGVRNGESLIAGGEAGLAGAASRTSLLGKLKTAGEIAAIIGLLDSIGQTFHAASSLQNAESTTRSALTKGLAPGASSEELRSRAAELNLDADNAHQAAHGFFAHVIEFGNRLTGDETAADRATRLAGDAEAEAKRLQALAKYKDQIAPVTGSTPLITSFDSDALSSALDSITANGGDAKDRLDALAAALFSTADAAKAAQEAFDPHVFAGEAAAGLQRTFQRTGYVGQSVGNGPLLAAKAQAAAIAALAAGGGARVGNIAGGPGATDFQNALPGAIQDTLSPTDISKRLEKALRARGVTSEADIGPKIATQLAGDVVGNTPKEALATLGITDPAQIAKLRQFEVDALKKKLLQEAHAVRDLIRGKNVHLTAGQATTAAERIVTETEARLGDLQQTDSAGRVATLRRQIALLRRTIASSPGGIAPDDVQNKLDAARRELADQQIADLENLRRAAQQNAHSKKEVAAIGRGFLVREVRIAVRAQDQDKLVELIGIAGKYGKEIALKAINNVISEAKAALALEKEAAAFQNYELGLLRGIGQVGVPSPSSNPRLDAYRRLRHSIQQAMHGNASTDVYATGSDANLPASLTNDKPPADTGPTAAQIAAARQSAYAAGSESQISQARAAIATARADMAAAKKGTVEYYSALSAYLTARNELTDAIQAYHQNLYLLTHDATDPVIQARAAARAAAAALRADANKPADVRAADRVEVQSSQAALEAARFQKRLEAVQTAEDLGRISFKAYINYLDHEHDRLKAIKDRNYQQQQELNQIDQLLKEAGASMQGIFNFGDIELPKPYQVRRYIEQKYGDIGSAGIGAGGGQVTSNTFHINGADTHMVIRILKDYLGNHVSLDATSPRKR